MCARASGANSLVMQKLSLSFFLNFIFLSQPRPGDAKTQPEFFCGRGPIKMHKNQHKTYQQNWPTSVNTKTHKSIDKCNIPCLNQMHSQTNALTRTCTKAKAKHATTDQQMHANTLRNTLKWHSQDKTNTEYPRELKG